MQLRAMHYDNRADPRILESGQYAWATKFNHFGLKASLPAGVGLIAQWMRGSTIMGPRIDAAHAVDTDFASYFALLTRAFERHRFSIRYDRFKVTQNDRIPEDNNSVHGNAWTASYGFAYSQHVEFVAEWLSISTHRCAFVYYGLDQDVVETQLLVTARILFGNR